MLKVRRATVSDADAIAKITKVAFEKYIKQAEIADTPALNESKEQIIDDINTKYVYVACEDEEVVGSVRITLRDAETAYLSRFGVNTENQNTGVGKILIDALDNELAKLNIKHIELHTASKAASLIHFYYNRGFYIDSTTKDKGYIRALMVKDLG